MKRIPWFIFSIAIVIFLAGWTWTGSPPLKTSQGTGLGPGFGAAQKTGFAYPINRASFRDGLVIEITDKHFDQIWVGGFKYVTQIYDTSGNSLNASQTDISFCPIISTGTDIYFNSTSKKIKLPTQGKDIKTWVYQLSFPDARPFGTPLARNLANQIIYDYSAGVSFVSGGLQSSPRVSHFTDPGSDIYEIGVVQDGATYTVMTWPINGVGVATGTISSFTPGELGGYNNFHGFWAWDRALTQAELSAKLQAIHQSRNCPFSKNAPSSTSLLNLEGVTIASATFRSGLELEYLKPNVDFYQNGGATFVSEIHDSSGNARHASQTVEMAMPTLTSTGNLWFVHDQILNIPALATSVQTIIFRYVAIYHTYGSYILGCVGTDYAGSLGWYYTPDYLAGAHYFSSTPLIHCLTRADDGTWISYSTNDGPKTETIAYSYDFTPVTIGHARVNSDSSWYFIGLWAWNRKMTAAELQLYYNICGAYTP